MAGAWTGISGSYLLGRTLGVGAVHRYGKYIHFTEDRLAYVHRWFDRIGHWMLVAGYYIIGVRHFTAVVAGMSKLEYPTFIAYAWTRRRAVGLHIPDAGLFSGRKLEAGGRTGATLYRLRLRGDH